MASLEEWMMQYREEKRRNRTQEETLELYKKLLANANQVIRKLTAENKGVTAMLSDGNRVQENNAEELGGDAQEPRNVLSLLPEEIWEVVLDKVEDRKEQQSCYNACQLFRDILEKSKNIRLFQKVYPLLMKHLDKSDQLKCRQICKGWRKDVEKLMPLNCIIKLPFNGELNAQRLLLEKMKLSGIENPFPMRRVCIEAFLEWGLEDDEDDEEEELLLNMYLEDVEQIFLDFGDQMETLVLDVNMLFKTEMQVCGVVQLALAHCRNLKTLKLGRAIFSTEDSANSHELAAVIPAGFAISKTLESLTIKSITGLLSVQNVIVKLCSNQLKTLRIAEWDTKLYAGLPWNSLQELDCGKYDFFKLKVLQSLAQTSAPNLTKLTLDCSSDERETLRYLILVASHFPKLNYLRLYDINDFSREDVATMPKGLLASPSLKTLEFPVTTAHWKSSRSRFEFLLFFPSIQTLNIGVPWKMEAEMKQEVNPDFVELSLSWLQKEKIYDSNLWELLPCLESIALGTLPWNGNALVYKPTYTKARYNAYQKKQNKIMGYL